MPPHNNAPNLQQEKYIVWSKNVAFTNTTKISWPLVFDMFFNLTCTKEHSPFPPPPRPNPPIPQLLLFPIKFTEIGIKLEPLLSRAFQNIVHIKDL
jgi:hypothetical protein